jgi:hypothetical protein
MSGADLAEICLLVTIGQVLESQFDLTEPHDLLSETGRADNKLNCGARVQQFNGRLG